MREESPATAEKFFRRGGRSVCRLIRAVAARHSLHAPRERADAEVRVEEAAYIELGFMHTCHDGRVCGSGLAEDEDSVRDGRRRAKRHSVAHRELRLHTERVGCTERHPRPACEGCEQLVRDAGWQAQARIATERLEGLAADVHAHSPLESARPAGRFNRRWWQEQQLACIGWVARKCRWRRPSRRGHVKGEAAAARWRRQKATDRIHVDAEQRAVDSIHQLAAGSPY